MGAPGQRFLKRRMLTAFAILTDGLVYAAYLFVVAIGLTLIFGVMKILNVAHGSFYAFGAYGAATAIGTYFDRGLSGSPAVSCSWCSSRRHGALDRAADRARLCASSAAGRSDRRAGHLSAFLILEDVIRLLRGAESYALYQPLGIAGNVAVGGLVLSGYDIGLVVFAIVLASVASYALRHTRYGPARQIHLDRTVERHHARGAVSAHDHRPQIARVELLRSTSSQHADTSSSIEYGRSMR